MFKCLNQSLHRTGHYVTYTQTDTAFYSLGFDWDIHLSEAMQKKSKKGKMDKNICQMHYKRNHKLFDTLSSKFGKTLIQG